MAIVTSLMPLQGYNKIHIQSVYSEIGMQPNLCYGIPDMCLNWDGLTYRDTRLRFLNVSNTYCFDPLCPRLWIKSFLPSYTYDL